MNKNNQGRLLMTLTIAFVLLLTGCSLTVEETPTATIAISPEITDTAEVPSATPEEVEVEQPGVVILLAPVTADQTQAGTWQTMLQDAASRHALGFEQRESLALDSVPQNLKLVVALSPVENLQTLVDGLPEVQFVAVGAAELTIQPNVSVLASSSSSENRAFIAGYVAAVQSNEYRIGIISTNSTQGQTYRQAFINGVWYFCGTCLPIYPPYMEYPVYEEVAPGATLEQIQAAASNMQVNQVQIVHLDPQLETEPVLQMLAQAGFYIIGSGAPPSGLEGNWVASVMTEPTMGPGEVLENALSGQALGFVSSGKPEIRFTGMSEARVNHVNEIIEMLESDEIDPVGSID